MTTLHRMLQGHFHRRTCWKVCCYTALLTYALLVTRCSTISSTICRTALSVTGQQTWVMNTLDTTRHSNLPRVVAPKSRIRRAVQLMNSDRICRTLVVIGGGAAGYFGAIQAASCAGKDKLRVVVLEAGRKSLSKVKISGGGRCNVMHDVRKPVSVISQGYPRGSKQLIGPFSSLFGPADAAAWFGERGVTLKTEGDGRMFPTTDDSQTIIDCLEGAARKACAQVVTSARVTSIRCLDEDGGASGDGDARTMLPATPRFEITFTTASPLSLAVRETLLVEEAAADVADRRGARNAAMRRGRDRGNDGSAEREKSSYRATCDYILQATGSSREGHDWAERLGHKVSAPVPSLFTLTIKDQRLDGLAGLSVQDAELKLTPEQPCSLARPQTERDSSSERSMVDAANVIRHSEDTGVVVDPTNTSAVNESKKDKTKKNKRGTKGLGKKKHVLLQRGPLLITHKGMSGPAALKLSAFAARELSDGGYRAKLVVNWLGEKNPSKVLEDLQAFRTLNPKSAVHAFCPIGGEELEAGQGGRTPASRDAVLLAQSSPSSRPPRRLWQSLACAAGVSSGDKWGDMSKAKLTALARELAACEMQVVGKGNFKEEFVTCGGVALSEIDMRTMESRKIPGLYFAGEVMDIDGITGGFNFQSAWTTGWVAGSSVGARAIADREGRKHPDC